MLICIFAFMLIVYNQAAITVSTKYISPLHVSLPSKKNKQCIILHEYKLVSFHSNYTYHS